jgi:hypothetical protein
MADFPVTTEIINLFKKVFIGTMKGVILWEKTADPGKLVAPLEGEYALLLEEVPDLEGKSDIPDNTLSLSKGRQIVFKLSRNDFETINIDFKIMLGDKYINPYIVFKDMWVSAYLKAHKISDEINIINSMLDKKLGKDNK